MSASIKRSPATACAPPPPTSAAMAGAATNRANTADPTKLFNCCLMTTLLLPVTVAVVAVVAEHSAPYREARPTAAQYYRGCGSACPGYRSDTYCSFPPTKRLRRYGKHHKKNQQRSWPW